MANQSESQDPSGPYPGDTVRQEKGILYMGIDLGTSRTSVSASNGIRETVPSFVGYPKDVVSRKLLKKDVLFGSEAIEHRLSLNLFRPLEDGVIKSSLDDQKGGTEAEENLRAAGDLIGEIISQAKPHKDDLIYAVIGVPAEASIKNKEAILKAARKAVDSVMLCSEPFAVAYGLDMLDDVLVIDIGAGTVDLCRMHGTMPEETDQLTMTCGGDSVDRSLANKIREKHPEAQFTIQMIKDIKERHASVSDTMNQAVVKLPVSGKPTEFDLTDLIREACREIVAPLVEGLAELIASFDPEFQDKLKNRVLLAGGGSMIKNLDDAIEAEMVERLGSGRVVRIEEPIYGGANGALKIANDMPDEFWDRLK